MVIDFELYASHMMEFDLYFYVPMATEGTIPSQSIMVQSQAYYVSMGKANYNWAYICIFIRNNSTAFASDNLW